MGLPAHANVELITTGLVSGSHRANNGGKKRERHMQTSQGQETPETIGYRRRQVVIDCCCKQLAVATANGRDIGIRTIIWELKLAMRPFLRAIATPSDRYKPGPLAEKILRRFGYLDELGKTLGSDWRSCPDSFWPSQARY